jgi:anti-sigma regulatory factor (Ser/Thr protein kinase)
VICEEARSHGGGMIADDLLVIGFEQPQLTQPVGELVLRLPSTPRAIDLACERVSECIKGSQDASVLDKGRLFDILLAVREALTNAVIHGNQNRIDAFVTLRCWPDPELGTLLISVSDEGHGFDLNSHAPPLDPLSERGRGIPLIQTYAQDVRMLGSELTMTFQLEEMAHDDR